MQMFHKWDAEISSSPDPIRITAQVAGGGSCVWKGEVSVIQS